MFSFLGLIAAAIGLGWYYRAEIQSFVLKTAEEKLQAKIEIRAVDVSFLRSFPEVDVQIQGLKMDLTSKSKKQLRFSTAQFLRAEQISFQLNFLSFLQKKYKVQKIKLNRIQLALTQNKSGKWNFEVITDRFSDPNAKPNPALQFALKQIQISDSELWISVPDFESRLNQLNLVFSGMFSQQEFALDAKADAKIVFLKHPETKLFKNKTISATCKLKVNKPKSEFRIEKSSVQFSEFGLALTGLVRAEKNKLYNDLEFHAESADFAKVISLMPDAWIQAVSGTQISGKVETEGTIRGWLAQKQIPGIQVKFQLFHGKLAVPEKHATVSDLSLAGKLFYPGEAKGKPYLELKQIQGNLANQPFYGSFSVELTKNPYIQSSLKGIFDLATLRSLLTGIPDSIQFSGSTEVNVSVSGFWQEIQQKNFAHSFAKGSIRFQNLRLKLPSFREECSAMQGKLHLANDQLEIEKLSGKWGSQSFKISGAASHYLPWLVDSNSTLKLQVQLETEFLNFEDWISGSADSVPTGIRLPKVEAKIAAKFDAFQLFSLKGKKLSGILELYPKAIRFADLRAEAFDGKLILSGTVQAGINPSLELDASFQNVNLDAFLQTYPQLGGIALIKDHLFGTCSIDGNFKTKLSPKLELIPATIQTKLQVRLNGGKLIRFKPLEKLSLFVKEEKLKEIHFQDMENTISIENMRLYIPKMSIFANDWRMTIEGSHGFDQTLDYHFHYFLRKKKPDAPKPSQEWVEVDSKPGREGWAIKLHITGTSDDPKFAWDKPDANSKQKSGSKSAIDEKPFLQKQKSELKEAFQPKNTTKVESWVEIEADSVPKKKRKP